MMTQEMSNFGDTSVQADGSLNTAGQERGQEEVDIGPVQPTVDIQSGSNQGYHQIPSMTDAGMDPISSQLPTKPEVGDLINGEEGEEGIPDTEGRFFNPTVPSTESQPERPVQPAAQPQTPPQTEELLKEALSVIKAQGRRLSQIEASHVQQPIQDVQAPAADPDEEFFSDPKNLDEVYDNPALLNRYIDYRARKIAEKQMSGVDDMVSRRVEAATRVERAEQAFYAENPDLLANRDMISVLAESWQADSYSSDSVQTQFENYVRQQLNKPRQAQPSSWPSVKRPVHQQQPAFSSGSGPQQRPAMRPTNNGRKPQTFFDEMFGITPNN